MKANTENQPELTEELKSPKTGMNDSCGLAFLISLISLSSILNAVIAQ